MTQKHKDMLRDNGKIPFFWIAEKENKRFVRFRNRITGGCIILRK